MHRSGWMAAAAGVGLALALAGIGAAAPGEAPGESPLVAPVAVEKPTIQFVGAASADGIRLRWTVAGSWLPPGGFRVLRRKAGEGEFAPVTPEPVRPRREERVGLFQTDERGAARGGLVSVEHLLGQCDLPAGTRGPGEPEPAALREVPRFRVAPPAIRSARDLTPEQLQDLLPPPPSSEQVEQEQRAIEGLGERSAPEAAVRDVQRARALVLTLGNTSWPAAEDLGLGYLDKGTQAGQAYEYRIEPLDAAGAPLAGWGVEPNAVARVTAGRDVQPPAPTGVVAEPGDRRVGLYWKSSTGASGDGVPWDGVVSSYNIYRSAARDAEPTRINELPVVVVYTPAKERGTGQDVMIEPRFLFVDQPDEAPGEADEKAAGKEEPGDVPAALIEAALGGAPRGQVAPVENGKEYFYRVDAVDVFGRTSARTEPVAARPFVPPLPPRLVAAPQRALPVADFEAAARALGAADGPVVRNANFADDVRLAWQAVPQVPGAAVAQYRVYRQEAGAQGAPQRAGEVPANATEFIDRAPPRDRSYAYTVRAVDPWGHESAPSEALYVVLPDHTPLPRPRITAVASAAQGDRAVAPGAREVRISVKWECPAAPNLAGFNVYRAEAAWPGQPVGPFRLCRLPEGSGDRADGPATRPIAPADPKPATLATLKAQAPPVLLPADARELRDWVPVQRSRSYVYAIEGVTRFGFTGERSENADVRVIGTQGPSAPHLLGVEALREAAQGAAAGDLALTWAAAPETEHVAAYNVYVAPAPADGAPGTNLRWQKVNAQPIAADPNTRTTPETDERAEDRAPLRTVAHRFPAGDLKPGDRALCSVEAVDADGLVSARGEAVSVTPIRLRARPPKGFAAAPGAEGVALTWVDDEPDLDGYLVERGLSKEGPYRQVIGMMRLRTPEPGQRYEFADRAAVPGREYWYRVITFDRHGNRAEPAVVGPIRLAPPAATP